MIVAGDNGFCSAASPCDVAVIIVTYNNEQDVAPLLRDLRRDARVLRMRVIVVDNDSSDGTLRAVREAADDAILVVNRGVNRGFAGGINSALNWVGDAEFLLVLNPDLRIGRGSVRALVDAARKPGVGASVPLMLDDTGAVQPSLRREPSLRRAFGDALLGSRVPRRAAWSSEVVNVGPEYDVAHDVAWATGAALLVRAAVAGRIGPWDERFFLYSEEVDYCRRIREAGWRIRFCPAATVTHHAGGSGSSEVLDALQLVNRVRYVQKWHPRAYATLFRAVTIAATLLRVAKPGRRYVLGVLLDRSRWTELPQARGRSAAGT